MARTRNFILDKGYDAAAALTAFRAVKFSGPETVTPVTAATDPVAGVAQFGATAAEIAKGKGGSIAVMGATEMEAAAAIAEGQSVQIAADGRATPAVAASGATIIGRCDEGASGAGARCRVTLSLPGRPA